MASVIQDTRKVFNFVVEVEGVNQYEIQKVTLPDVEIDSTVHGGDNTDIKTPGRVKTGDLVFEKVRPAAGSDTWAWDWLMDAQNPNTGTGKLATSVKRLIIIKEMAPDGVTTLNSWAYKGCWVKKVAPGTLDRLSSDNLIETVTLSVDKPVRI